MHTQTKQTKPPAGLRGDSTEKSQLFGWVLGQHSLQPSPIFGPENTGSQVTIAGPCPSSLCPETSVHWEPQGSHNVPSVTVQLPRQDGLLVFQIPPESPVTRSNHPTAPEPRTQVGNCRACQGVQRPWIPHDAGNTPLSPLSPSRVLLFT